MVWNNYKLLTKIIHFGTKWGGHIWLNEFHGSLIIVTFKKVCHKQWLWLIQWLWGTLKKTVLGSYKSRSWSLKGHCNLISVSKEEENVKWSDEIDPHLRLRKHRVLIFWKAINHVSCPFCKQPFISIASDVEEVIEGMDAPLISKANEVIYSLNHCLLAKCFFFFFLKII